ncbi:MAG: c-type cytochrome [Candidatus Acidiferrales bacterium]
MRIKAVLLVAALALLAGAVALGVWVARHGFSAREKPSWVEAYLVRHARRIATPAGARELRNPYPLTPERLVSARAHWADHCATCHALDGSGATAIGKNMYPPAPDMRDATTQSLSDGELFYIISNGVRFTGMPAWGGEHSPEETWELVGFLRRLPALTLEELKEMEEMAKTGSAGGHSHDPGGGPHAH